MTRQEKLSKGIEQTIKLCRQEGFTDAEITREVLSYEAKNKVVIEVRCSYCGWSQFKDEGAVGMTPCWHCDSTGYIFEPLIEEVRNVQETTNETTQESNPGRA